MSTLLRWVSVRLDRRERSVPVSAARRPAHAEVSRLVAPGDAPGPRTTCRTALRSRFPYGLQVAELPDPCLRQLTPVPGILDAAERQLRVRFRHAVDEDGAGVDAAGEPVFF